MCWSRVTSKLYLSCIYEFHLSCIKVASFSIQNNFDTLFWYFWILNLFGPCFFLAAKHAYTFHNLTDSLTDRLTISFSIYFWSPTFTIAKLSVNFNWDSLIPNFSSHPPTPTPTRARWFLEIFFNFYRLPGTCVTNRYKTDGIFCFFK